MVRKSLEALMAVLEGGKGPKSSTPGKHVATPLSQAPSSRAASPSHCLRALPRPDPSQGPHFLLAQKQGAWDHRALPRLKVNLPLPGHFHSACGSCVPLSSSMPALLSSPDHPPAPHGCFLCAPAPLPAVSIEDMSRRCGWGTAQRAWRSLLGCA